MKSALLLPDGFVSIIVGNRTIHHATEFEPSVRKMGFFEGAPAQPALGTVTGRSPHAIYELPGAGFQVLWKKCGRGGWAEPLLKDRYRSPQRFLDELVLTEAARAKGVSVPRILAVADTRTSAGWHRVEVLCEVVPDALDGAALLSEDLPPRQRASVLMAAAQELRRFHGLGLLHGDLNVKNVLWRLDQATGLPQITLIDLDPGGSMGQGSAHANLLRLHRSYWKGVLRGAWQLRPADLYRFVDEYFRGDRASVRDFWRSARRQAQIQSLRRGRRMTGIATGSIEPGGRT